MELTFSIGITVVVILVAIVLVRKICNFFVTKKHEYEDEHRDIAKEFLLWMSKETKAIKDLIREDPDSKVDTGYAILFLYKKKVYCGIKCLEHNKFKFVYKNLLRHRIKKFDNYDAFRNYYYNNRAKMILSIKNDKGIYD